MAAEDEDNPPTDEGDWADATIGPPPLKRSVHANFDGDVVDSSSGAGGVTDPHERGAAPL